MRVLSLVVACAVVMAGCATPGSLNTGGPSGDVLHYLPFAALRTADGRWLVEEYALATLPSASVLKFLAGKGAQAPDRVLAVGNPDLGPGLALRYAGREARLVGERYPGTTVLVRGQATEARGKALAPGSGLIHFATHGNLSENDPLGSALLLVPDGAEDGRLEVRELFGLELNARLVVLSACETGLGKPFAWAAFGLTGSPR